MPHLYDAVRRFENFFKSVCCSQINLPCHLCSRKDCLYAYIFRQALSSDPDVVRRHQKPPLPFSFKISVIKTNISCIELGIVIAGNAIQHISIFQDAITLMVNSVAENIRVDAAVSKTWCLDYQGGRHECSSGSHSLVLLSALEILHAPQHSDSVKIYFESPLRLLYAGSVSHSFDFASLLRSQMRRCSSFFAYFGEGELELDYVFISKGAESVTSLENGFTFTKPQWTLRASLAGILGAGEFTGLTDGMLALLVLGSYLNAGKGAAYGMGVYRLEVV